MATVGTGCALFTEMCARDLEGIVGKWAEAPYGLLDGRSSWVKSKNPGYSLSSAINRLSSHRDAFRGTRPDTQSRVGVVSQ